MYLFVSVFFRSLLLVETVLHIYKAIYHVIVLSTLSAFERALKVIRLTENVVARLNDQ